MFRQHDNNNKTRKNVSFKHPANNDELANILKITQDEERFCIAQESILIITVDESIKNLFKLLPNDDDRYQFARILMPKIDNNLKLKLVTDQLVKEDQQTFNNAWNKQSNLTEIEYKDYDLTIDVWPSACRIF